MKKKRPRKGKKGEIPEKETKDVIDGAQTKKKVKHNADYLHPTMNGIEMR